MADSKNPGFQLAWPQLTMQVLYVTLVACLWLSLPCFAVDANNANVTQQTNSTTNLTAISTANMTTELVTKPPEQQVTSEPDFNNTTGFPTIEDVHITTSHVFHRGFTKHFSLICRFYRLLSHDIAGVNAMILSYSDFNDNGFQKIAGITTLPGTKVDVENNLGNAEVTAHIDYVGNDTFISYMWLYPGSEVQGQYQCVVYGFDVEGQPAMSTTSATVEEQPVDVDTVMGAYQECEKSKDLLMNHLNNSQPLMNIAQNGLEKSNMLLNSAQQELIHSNQVLKNTQGDLEASKVLLNSTKHDIDQLHQRRDQLAHLVRQLQKESIHANHLYFFSEPQAVNASQFQQECHKNGGYLAEINDENEYQFVKSLIKSVSHASSTNYMLGMTKIDDKSKWTYMSSKADIKFEKWTSGKPEANGSKHCAIWNASGTWDDIDCEDSQSSVRYMCEVEL